jgi:RNA polymerase sigma factor (TIGR02999 family)
VDAKGSRRRESGIGPQAVGSRIVTRSFSEEYNAAYQELLRLAHARLSREKAPISTMTLAHEVYLSLQGRGDLRFGTRLQFLAYASRAMRSLLVDMARERLAMKRSAELLPLTLGAEVSDYSGSPEGIVAIEQALVQLEAQDARQARITEMRLIAGMEIPDIAAALEISEPTVKRDWLRAKQFIAETLEKGA